MRRADIEVPNLAVDVNSWARSACYPRGSFCPISHGPSTQNRRITLSCFRTCSTCWSRSQAPLCQCTPRAISIRPEGTFERLRYTLGGDRPSQTAHQALFPGLTRVRARNREEWYFTVGSTPTSVGASQPPTYPTHHCFQSSAKMQ